MAIVDARAREAYASGHIPGALNVNCRRNAVTEAPKFWRRQDEPRAMYEEAGVPLEKRIIPFCTTGVRSSATFFSLQLIGYYEVTLYTGSWEEWSNHSGTPRTVGSQP